MGFLKSVIQYRDSLKVSGFNAVVGPYQGLQFLTQTTVYTPSHHATVHVISATYTRAGDMASFLSASKEAGSGNSLFVSYTRNSLNFVTQIQRSNGYETENVYNHQGELVGIVFEKGLSFSIIPDDGYKGAPVLRRITQLGVAGSVMGGHKGPPLQRQPSTILSYHYVYNLNHEPTQLTITPGPFAPNAIASSGSAVYTYVYNAQNELTRVTMSGSNVALYPHNAFGSAISQQQFTYGLDHQIKTVTTTFAKHTGNTVQSTLTAVYGYKSTMGHPNQLSHIIFSGNYQYLAALKAEYHGKDFAYNDLNQISTDPQAGQYQYNLNDRVIGYASASGVNLRPSVRVVYGRNAQGLENYEQSYLKTSSGDNNPANGEAVYLSQLAGLDLAQQGNTTMFTQPGFANFVTTTSGRGVSKVSKTDTQDLYAIAQGNIAMTSRQNNIGHLYTYSPYGIQSDALHPVNPNQANDFNVRSHRKVLSIKQNRRGYTGQTKDQSTGYMMLGGFRLYDPSLGAYLGHDTLNIFSRHHVLNPWAYVKGNPVAYTDPTGHVYTCPEDLPELLDIFDESVGGRNVNQARPLRASATVVAHPFVEPNIVDGLSPVRSLGLSTPGGISFGEVEPVDQGVIPEQLQVSPEHFSLRPPRGLIAPIPRRDDDSEDADSWTGDDVSLPAEEVPEAIRINREITSLMQQQLGGKSVDGAFQGEGIYVENPSEESLQDGEPIGEHRSIWVVGSSFVQRYHFALVGEGINTTILKSGEVKGSGGFVNWYVLRAEWSLEDLQRYSDGKSYHFVKSQNHLMPETLHQAAREEGEYMGNFDIPMGGYEYGIDSNCNHFVYNTLKRFARLQQETVSMKPETLGT